MASTGAQCDHVNHVSTQLPYAMLVAAVCAIGYLLSGFVQKFVTDYVLSVAIVLGFSLAMMLLVLFLMKMFMGGSSL